MVVYQVFMFMRELSFVVRMQAVMNSLDSIKGLLQ